VGHEGVMLCNVPQSLQFLDKKRQVLAACPSVIQEKCAIYEKSQEIISIFAG
jgi:hypothetical protein